MMNKSFGPAATVTTDNEVQISCITKQTYCFQMLGNKCMAVKPERDIPDAANTPDWCPYAAGTREDVQEMLDYDRMGLTDMTRDELMKLMKDVPHQFRAKYQDKLIPLNAHNAPMMRRAIRRMRLAQETAR